MFLGSHERCGIPGFFEGTDDRSDGIDRIGVVFRCQMSQQQRHALVGSVRLAQGAPEVDEPAAAVGFEPRQPRICRPAVAVEGPVVGARRLADHEHYHFAARVGPDATGVKTELRFVGGALTQFYRVAAGEPGVVEGIDRKDVAAESQLAAESGCYGDCGCGNCQPQGIAALAHEAVAADIPAFTQHDGGKCQRRHIENNDYYDRRQHVAQQLSRLAGIGCHKVEKHVDGDDRPFVEP